ncbi:MAG: photosystem II stability/assembly factor-like uncharacterized protein [Planctomycetota bacterium]|jgi:photosystem II stability/assembly factor-like uncharacterized protein
MSSLLNVLLAAASLGGDPPAKPLPHHPHDIISAVAFAPGYPADPRMFVASPGTINLFLVSNDRGLTWKPSRSGIRGQVFRQIVLASDWDTSGVTYVVTKDGGLQVSENAGKTWGDPVHNHRLSFLVVPPVAEDGTRAVFFAAGHEMMASFDGGKTSHRVFAPKAGHIESIAVSPGFEHDRTIFAGTSTGLLMTSKDAGKTWSSIKLAAPATHIEPSPNFAEDQVMWVSTWGAGVLRSDDGGKTFGSCGVGLTDGEVNEVRATRGTTTYELFACTRNDGVFLSMDGGKGWTHTALRVNKTTQTTNHYTSLAISPNWPEDKTVLCGSFEGLNISHDGGTTWRESNVNPPRIGRIVDVSPTFAKDQHVFACGYGMHLLVSEDAADNWDLRFTGMDAGSVYDIAPAPDFADSQLVMLGMYKGVRRSEDAGRTWTKIQFESYPGEPKDGYTTRSITFAPGYPKDRRVYAVGTRGMFYRSGDLGRTWEATRVVTDWATSVVLSPDFETDQTLYVAGTHVWVSKDAGTTFSRPLYNGSLFSDGLLLSPDFKASGEMYAIVKYKGFVVGSDRGMSWEAHNEGLEGYIPSALKLSPQFLTDNTMFVLTSGGGMFRSTDRGRTWQRVSALGGPVDQGFTLSLSPDFSNDQTMFVGTFSGFWRSRDAGLSWVATTRMEVYDEKRDPWQRLGDWKKKWGGAPVNNTVTVSSTKGDVMSIGFEGIACKLVGPMGMGYGVASITIDDDEPILFDQYSPSELHQQVLFEIADLKPGSHHIAVRVTGEKAKQSTGTMVGVDALEVVFR